MSQLSFLDHLKQVRRALSVSELTQQIKQLIEDNFFDVLVEGELSNFRRHSSGHWYFSLKDGNAMIRCASFRMQNRWIRFSPEEGLKVRARGRLSLYDARGEYQLLVENLEPVGVGALQLAFEQLKKKLDAEGLFEASRKRPLPLLPRCVGVVTSPTGAAIRDILRVIRRRNEGMSVLIAPARVQGEGAAIEVATAIKRLNLRSEVDVIIVGRGGGSIEDLWTFNEESVARAIHKSAVPVISAIGHETDFTIADFVADIRASTPSAAAELVTHAREEISMRISRLTDHATRLVRYRLLQLQNRLSELESSRGFDRAVAQIRAVSQRLDESVYRMETAARQCISHSRTRLDTAAIRLREADVRRVLSNRRGKLDLSVSALEALTRKQLSRNRQRFAVAAGRLASLSPLAVLSRGYAIAFDRSGRVITRAGEVGKGELVRVRVAEGEMDCTRQ